MVGSKISAKTNHFHSADPERLDGCRSSLQSKTTPLGPSLRDSDASIKTWRKRARSVRRTDGATVLGLFACSQTFLVFHFSVAVNSFLSSGIPSTSWDELALDSKCVWTGARELNKVIHDQQKKSRTFILFVFVISAALVMNELPVRVVATLGLSYRAASSGRHAHVFLQMKMKPKSAFSAFSVFFTCLCLPPLPIA